MPLALAWRCCSSFSAETVSLLQAQRYWLALGNTSLHVAGSLVLTYLGLQSVALVWHLNA